MTHQNASLETQLRATVDAALRLGAKKQTIADAAGISRGRFVDWTNNPGQNLTMKHADNIRTVCLRLIEQAQGGKA